MYPLDFEEFAWAMGEEQLVNYIKGCFERREPLERGMHNKAMMLFKQYMRLLSQHEKCVVFKNIQEGSYAEQYSKTFF